MKRSESAPERKRVLSADAKREWMVLVLAVKVAGGAIPGLAKGMAYTVCEAHRTVGGVYARHRMEESGRLIVLGND